MMTGGDSRVMKHHRTTSDLLLELKRRTPQPPPLMLDKAVQSTCYQDMDDIVTTSANDNVSAANDNVSSVTVAEINSPSEDDASRPLQRATTNCSEDSGLVSDEGFGAHLEDAVDTATLQLRPTKHNFGSSKDDMEDEIKEQSPPPPLLANNCKLRDQFEETKDDDDKLPDYDNNCALDCLAFTLECCQCVVL